jgi:hypothetical protein
MIVHDIVSQCVVRRRNLIFAVILYTLVVDAFEISGLLAVTSRGFASVFITVVMVDRCIPSTGKGILWIRRPVLRQPHLLSALRMFVYVSNTSSKGPGW